MNFPDVGVEIKGIKFTSLGSKVYTDHYELNENGRYALIGAIEENTGFRDCDVDWIKRGYITITPLKYDKSDYETLKILGEKCITL